MKSASAISVGNAPEIAGTGLHPNAVVTGSPSVGSEPGSISIKPYSHSDAARWDDFVGRAAGSSFCHLSGWMRVIERVWGHHPKSIYAESNGRVTGVLPLFLVRGGLLGISSNSMLVSTPNAVYGGAVADDPETHQALIAAAKNLAQELKVDYLELRETAYASGNADQSFDNEFLQQELYVCFDHPITTDEEAMIKTFPRDIRRMIRQGTKHGLVSEVGGAELLDDFYEVYATSVRNLGTPVFPKRLFAEFLREFPDACDILIIRQAGRVAGAVLNFYFRDVVMPYYGGAYQEFYRAGINNFMYWELMRRAAARGFTRFDFGRSKQGTGACEFKRGWGMSEHALPYKFYLVRAESMPNLNPANPKFKLMIAAWKRLPLSLTKLIGPMIVKNIP